MTAMPVTGKSCYSLSVYDKRMLAQWAYFLRLIYLFIKVIKILEVIKHLLGHFYVGWIFFILMLSLGFDILNSFYNRVWIYSINDV